MFNKSLFQSDRHDWQTPWHLWEQWHAEFQFTIDATANADNAMLPRFWTIEDDALLQDWSGERVWCNPPYGRDHSKFIRKAAFKEAEIAVLLLPVRTDTIVWHEAIFPIAEVRFLKGRLKFNGATNMAPFPSALVIWRSEKKSLTN